MRNLKRALSLAMASVMLLGMMVVGTSAASFQDVDSSNDLEAIEILNAVGVMQGDERGFRPNDPIARNEMAKVMALLLKLSPADYTYAVTPFTDVPDWAKPYVAACYANGITNGTSATTFSGGDNVTAVQAARMMLRALGYLQHKEDDGDDWVLATTTQASKIGLFKGVNQTGVHAALTRNQVATMAVNALESTMVEDNSNLSNSSLVQNPDGTIGAKYKPNYTNMLRVESTTEDYDQSNAPVLIGGQNINVNNHSYGAMQLCEFLYGNDLKKATGDDDDFGRPADCKWTWKGKDVVNVVKKPVAVFTAKTGAGDVAKVLGNYYLADAGRNNTYRINNDTKYYTDTVAGKYARNDFVTSSSLYTASSTTAGTVVTALSIGDTNTNGGKTLAKSIAGLTANGKLVEVYANSDSVVTDIVTVTYDLAKVTDVLTEGGKTTYAVNRGIGSFIDYDDPDATDSAILGGTVAKGDWVTCIKLDNKCWIYPTTTFTGTQTDYITDNTDNTVKTMVIDGTDHTPANGVAGAVNTATDFRGNTAGTFWVDQYGHIVRSTASSSNNYVYVVSVGATLSRTADGQEPVIKIRGLLADGTVGVYEVALTKLNAGNSLIGKSLGGATLAAGDYVTKDTKLASDNTTVVGQLIYDATEAEATMQGRVESQGNGLLNNAYAYTLNGSTITLEVKTALPGATSSNVADSTYTGNITDVDYGKTSYTIGSNQVLSNDATRYVVYNKDAKTATVYVGVTNVPKSLTTADGGTIAGVFMGDTGSTNGLPPVASVIFLETNNGLDADNTENVIYVDKAKFTRTASGDKDVYTYTGVKADGTKVSVTTINNDRVVNSGLFLYTSDFKINATSPKVDTASDPNTTDQYVYGTSMQVVEDLVNCGGNYYAISEDTQIIYVDSDAYSVDGNDGFVVLSMVDGLPTTKAETIYVTKRNY